MPALAIRKMNLLLQACLELLKGKEETKSERYGIIQHLKEGLRLRSNVCAWV